MYLRDAVTPWVITGLVLFALGSFIDIGVCVVTTWGYAETSTIYTHVGLFRVCNGTRLVTRRDEVELMRSDPHCFSSTKLDYDWMMWTLVMECLGLIASCTLLVAMVAFLISLRRDWILSRSALVALIPIAICAATFNVIGVTSLGTNLDDVKATSQYAVGLDALGAAFFAIGAVMCVLDLQGCCMHRPPSTVGKGLMRPI